MRIIRKTHTFRNSYCTLKTIHKKKYPTASMDSMELHGVRVDEKQLKIVIHIANLRVQAEYGYMHMHAYAHAYACICACICIHMHAYACVEIPWGAQVVVLLSKMKGSGLNC